MSIPDWKNVKAFAFDVDGVFSGQILLGADGQQIHPLNMKDGYAIQLLVKLGYPLAIITGGTSELVKTRFERLGVTDIFLRSSNKLNVFTGFIEKYSLQPQNVLYMGDDIPDYQIMQKVGFAVCPSDAATDILELSDWTTSLKGGEGCVREIIELVLKAQNNWMGKESFIW